MGDFIVILAEKLKPRLVEFIYSEMIETTKFPTRDVVYEIVKYMENFDIIDNYIKYLDAHHDGSIIDERTIFELIGSYGFYGNLIFKEYIDIIQFAYHIYLTSYQYGSKNTTYEEFIVSFLFKKGSLISELILSNWDEFDLSYKFINLFNDNHKILTYNYIPITPAWCVWYNSSCKNKCLYEFHYTLFYFCVLLCKKAGCELNTEDLNSRVSIPDTYTKSVPELIPLAKSKRKVKRDRKLSYCKI